MRPGKLSPALDPAAATRLLFDEHARMVLAVCRAILRDGDEAQDAVQETFLAAHRALLAGHRPRRPSSWLAAIARNECRARLRRRATTPQPVDFGDLPARTDPAEAADAHEDLQWLTGQIRALPERQRETLVLRELHGLSNEQIAAAAGVSQGVVRGLLARARSRLRKGRRALPAPVFLDPAGIREQLVRLVPGFEPAAVSGASTASAAWTPIAAKLAVASGGLAMLAPAAAPTAPLPTKNAAPQRVAPKHVTAPPPARPAAHRLVVTRTVMQAPPAPPSDAVVHTPRPGREGHHRDGRDGQGSGGRSAGSGHGATTEGVITSSSGPGRPDPVEQEQPISSSGSSGPGGGDEGSSGSSSSSTGPSSTATSSSSGSSGSDSGSSGSGSSGSSGSGSGKTAAHEESSSGHGRGEIQPEIEEELD